MVPQVPSPLVQLIMILTLGTAHLATPRYWALQGGLLFTQGRSSDPRAFRTLHRWSHLVVAGDVDVTWRRRVARNHLDPIQKPVTNLWS